jgi:hypothetical protein
MVGDIMKEAGEDDVIGVLVERSVREWWISYLMS